MRGLSAEVCVKPQTLSYKCVCQRSPSRRQSGHNKAGFSQVGSGGEHLDEDHSWMCSSSAAVRLAVRGNVQVLKNFISKEEEAAFLKELEPGLKKKRYEFDHWDDVRSDMNYFSYCYDVCHV